MVCVALHSEYARPTRASGAVSRTADACHERSEGRHDGTWIPARERAWAVRHPSAATDRRGVRGGMPRARSTALGVALAEPRAALLHPQPQKQNLGIGIDACVTPGPC